MSTTTNPSAPCVYLITCHKGLRYVGCTSHFKHRKGDHISQLNKGTHYNKPLQLDWNKHGAGCFEFRVLKYYKTRVHAYKVEAYNISKHYHQLYNIQGTAISPKYIDMLYNHIDGLEKIGWSVEELTGFYA